MCLRMPHDHGYDDAESALLPITQKKTKPAWSHRKVLFVTLVTLSAIWAISRVSVRQLSVFVVVQREVANQQNPSDKIESAAAPDQMSSMKPLKIASSTDSFYSDNDFVQAFEKALLKPEGSFVAFIIDGGKVYYRQKHLDILLNGTSGVRRFRYYAQMVTAAISLLHEDDGTTLNIDRQHTTFLTGKIEEGGGLPLLTMCGDENGCSGEGKNKYFKHPRLTWSIPSKRQGCSAIGVPGYKSWNDHRLKSSHSEWDSIFETQEQKYPWSEKILKAVWRGASTGRSREEVTKRSFEHKPRARLVQHSIDHPDIIDAAFHKVFLESGAGEEKPQTRMADRMRMEEFMQYRAVIDIDGNNWSSRFGELLCMNLVVIKIEPDFIEYFYENIRPWIHYMPVYGNMTNLEDVVTYVLDNKNDEEMKKIINAANIWCQHSLTGTQMAADMIDILSSYNQALATHDNQWREKWIGNRIASGQDIDDLVEFTGFP